MSGGQIVSRNLIIRIATNTVVLMALAGFFPNHIYFSYWGYGILAGVLLGLTNHYLKPFITLVALPINMMTFGITALMINGFMLELISYLMQPHFKISSFLVAILVATVINIINSYYSGNIKVKFMRIHHKDDK